jgi:choice-of-anchor B domain-containing protein
VLDAATGAPAGVIRANAGRAVSGGGSVLNVKVRGDVLYAATTSRGLLAFDISDAANARFLGQYLVDAGRGSRESFFNVHNIYLSPRGDIVYAVNQSTSRSHLRLIDVSDPSAPREAGRFSIEAGGFYNGPHDLNVIEQDGRLIAFVNYMREGLVILDVTDPAAIVRLGSLKLDGAFSHSGWPFTIDGRLLYVHADEGPDQHLAVFDVSNLSEPRLVSRFETRDGISVHNVEVVDGIAYVSYYIDGLRVIDLRDPSSPHEIAHYDTVPAGSERDILQGAWGVHVDSGRVFISDMEGGIFAFEVAVP